MNILYISVKSRGFEARHDSVISMAKNLDGKISDNGDGNIKASVITYDASKQKSIKQIILYFKQIRTIINNNQSDIVHLHGCWSFIAFITILYLKRKHIITIYSPNGGLYNFNKHNKRFWKELLPKWICFQYAMLRINNYYITKDNIEANTIKRYNKTAYIATLRKPTENLSNQLYCIYQTIIDANVYHYMNEKEKVTFNILLRVGIDKIADCMADTFSQNYIGWRIKNDQIETIRTLTNQEIRHINLFAKKMKVTDVINNAFNTLQMTTITQSEDYNNFYINTEKNISLTKLKFKQDILSQLLQLYLSLKYSAFNETQLAETLRKKKLYSYIGRIEAILEEMIFLEEGYMPLPAKYDRGTKAIAKRLEKTFAKVIIQ